MTTRGWWATSIAINERGNKPHGTPNLFSYLEHSTQEEVASSTEINLLDIADGLKECLIKHGFTLETLLSSPCEKTATDLGIDLYVVNVIYVAARRYCTLKWLCTASLANPIVWLKRWIDRVEWQSVTLFLLLIIFIILNDWSLKLHDSS